MAKNITVQKILGILLHRLPMILLSGVLVALIFFIYTSVAIKPVYSTSAMIFIQNYGKQQASSNANSSKQSSANTSDDKDSASTASNSESLQSNNEVAQKIFNSDLAGSAALASNCITLFQNSNEVTRYYDGCNVSMAVAENTFYITITATGNDPQKCANVANIVAEKCAEVFHARFTYGQIGTIRDAETPGKPISPNKMQNAFIGAAVGIILACVIAILLELIDTTIKNDDDLNAIYKVPVFAEIPDFES